MLRRITGVSKFGLIIQPSRQGLGSKGEDLKILFLTFYFDPDLCAGSFRASALVRELQTRGISVEVVTTAPNRYSSFAKASDNYEVRGNVTIRRVSIPKHASGMMDQIFAFSVFWIKALWHVRKRKYDAVFATSSRLFTGVLGAAISRWRRVPLYLDIRDIFVDTCSDVLSYKTRLFLIPCLNAIERFTFNQAIHINLVSQGFSEYFSKNFKVKNLSYFTNGIDSIFVENNVIATTVKPQATNDVNPLVLYAGNIGEGQGLHRILPDLARRRPDVEFLVIGDGGRSRQLADATAELVNVKILPPVSREELLGYYGLANVFFIHLNDHAAFEKVLPSKVFEYAAFGKPILAGVSGFAAQFLREEVGACEIFSPCDGSQALQALEVLLRQGSANNSAFVEKYDRTKIMEQMASSIVEVFSQCGSR